MSERTERHRGSMIVPAILLWIAGYGLVEPSIFRLSYSTDRVVFGVIGGCLLSLACLASLLVIRDWRCLRNEKRIDGLSFQDCILSLKNQLRDFTSGFSRALQTENSRCLPRPRWWRYLICPFLLVYGIAALLGTFMFHEPVGFLMLMVMAAFGTVLFSYQYVQSLSGTRKHATALLLVTISAVAAMLTTPAWAFLFRVSFWRIVGAF